jgi:hypothetical protein
MAISLTPDRLLCTFMLALLRTSRGTRDIVRNTASCWERIITNFPPLLLDSADKIRPDGSFLALIFRVCDRNREDWVRFLYLASRATSVALISRPQTTAIRSFNHLTTISYTPFNITELHLIGFTVDRYHLFEAIKERQPLVSMSVIQSHVSDVTGPSLLLPNLRRLRLGGHPGSFARVGKHLHLPCLNISPWSRGVCNTVLTIHNHCHI